MAYLDAFTLVCSSQAVVADAVSEDSVDLGNVTPKRKVGVGEVMGIMIAIKALGTTSGSAIIYAVTSAAAALTSPIRIGAIGLATADLAVGKKYFIPFAHGIDYLRYIGLDFDITGTVDFTVDAWVTSADMASTGPENYADGFTIS